MTGKRISPETTQQAVILREAGHSLASISESLGISIRTLQRLFSKRNTVKGALIEDAIEQAKEDLLASAFNNDELNRQRYAPATGRPPVVP